MTLVFKPLFAWSVLVRIIGALACSSRGWNVVAVNALGNHARVDLPPYREMLWSFRDRQIGYIISRFRQTRAARKHLVNL